MAAEQSSIVTKSTLTLKAKSENPFAEYTVVNDIKIMKRELDIHLSDNDAKWNEWRHAISPIVHKAFWLRDEVGLGSDVLPGDIGGCYEIAVQSNGIGPLYCIYVGRAQKVHKNIKKGTTLRKRLHNGYAHSGSHISNELDQFLSRNFHVWMRWCICTTVTECLSLEVELIKKYDYAINKIDSLCINRFPKQVLCKIGDTIKYLFYHVEFGSNQEMEMKKIQEKLTNNNIIESTFSALENELYVQLLKIIQDSKCTIESKSKIIQYLDKRYV